MPLQVCWMRRTFAMAVTGDAGVQIGPADTLLLHPSDHPGQALVTDIFTGDNYENWRRTVRIATHNFGALLDPR